MRSLLGAFPTETLLLRKKNGECLEIVALVDGNKIFSEDVDAVIEEGDVFVRTIPNGSKEYYRVVNRGFYNATHGIKAHYQSEVEKVTQSIAEQELACVTDEGKPHKLFVSHSSNDRECVTALAEMLEEIGLPDGSFVCTSVPGHGIPGGAKIFDWLRDQFLTCDLRVLFVLSGNYYESPACLNEMGAAWVTKTTDTLLLLPGFDYGDIRGCIDSRTMGISFGADDEELKHRLNELKDTLIKEHQLPPITQVRWERHRDKFIREVKASASTSDVKVRDSVVVTSPVIGQDDVGPIPVEPAFLLVYAAYTSDGQILRIRTLSSPTQVTVAGRQFAKDMSPREAARWEEALDLLIAWGWVKEVGHRGQVYELTGTGYKKADWLKDCMEIDTNRDPMEELKDFE